MALSWTDLEARPEFSGIRTLVEREMIPAFEAVPVEPSGTSGAPKALGRWLGLGMVLFMAMFGATFFLLPGNWFGEVLRLLLFFPLFIAAFAIVLWVNRRPLLDWLLRAKTRYVARARALSTIAGRAGLAYVPRPGGEHPFMEWLARQDWLPGDYKTALEGMPASDLSMAPAVEAARRARIMGREPTVLGNEEQKARYEAQALQLMNVEDGFQGRRGGVAFDAFEWVEKEEDAPDVHHLVIVLKVPRPFQSITELRARKVAWLVFRDQAEMLPVDLGPRAFHERYRLRSSDQVEARAIFDPAVIERLLTLAHDGRFRAVARGEHLVFDLEGEDRFALLDPATGQFSDETIRKGLSDLAETLDLVDALAATFRVTS